MSEVSEVSEESEVLKVPEGVAALEVAGIAALVRAGDAKQWFFGHFGAAVIAGARLLGDPNRPGPAALALSNKLQSMLDANRDWYSPLADTGTTVVGVDPILTVLRRSAGSLRTSGHPTIYMTAALYVLSRQPTLATERVVAALVALHEAARDDHASRYYGHADYFEIADRPSVEFTSDQVGNGLTEPSRGAIQAAFEALGHLVVDHQVDGRHYFFTGERIHLITHLHAIATLEALGHRDIVVAANRAQESLGRLIEASNAMSPSEFEPARSTPNDVGFWQQETVDPAHVIKMAEAAAALIPRLAFSERRVAEEKLAGLWSLLGIR